MRFTGESDASGRPVKQQMTLRAVSADTVVHRTEQLSADGSTWTNVWNATYVRRK